MCRVTRDEMTGSVVRMIGFICSFVTRSFSYTQITQEIQRYRWFTHIFQFTVAHALGFSVSTSRLLATDHHTESITQITTNIPPKIFQLHFQYRCPVSHIKPSIHTLHLHSQTSCILLVYDWIGWRCIPFETELLAPIVSRITPLHGPHGKRSSYYCKGVFTERLPSNGRGVALTDA
jgi:hypothetical protein